MKKCVVPFLDSCPSIGAISEGFRKVPVPPNPSKWPNTRPKKRVGGSLANTMCCGNRFNMQIHLQYASQENRPVCGLKHFIECIAKVIITSEVELIEVKHQNNI